jgi:hypothetical protein
VLIAGEYGSTKVSSGRQFGLFACRRNSSTNCFRRGSAGTDKGGSDQSERRQKNVQGKMHGTTVPRIPGRDFAGVVIEGPDELLGQSVSIKTCSRPSECRASGGSEASEDKGASRSESELKRVGGLIIK